MICHATCARMEKKEEDNDDDADEKDPGYQLQKTFQVLNRAVPQIPSSFQVFVPVLMFVVLLPEELSMPSPWTKTRKTTMTKQTQLKLFRMSLSTRSRTISWSLSVLFV